MKSIYKNSQPKEEELKSIWENIKPEIPEKKITLILIRDKTSFYYGIAASIIVFLAFNGLYQFVLDLNWNSKQDIQKAQIMYHEAVSRLEEIPVLVSENRGENSSGYIESRQKGLKLIDQRINELQNDIAKNPISSELQFDELRKLYSKKIDIIQQMLQKGEI